MQVLLCITNSSIKHQSFFYTKLNHQFYFKQFNLAQVICLHSVWMSNSSIWLIDRTLSGASNLGKSGPGSDGNEVLHIPQSSSITGASPSDCLMSYLGHLLGRGLTPLQRCSLCIQQPQPMGFTLFQEQHLIYLAGLCRFLLEIYAVSNLYFELLQISLWVSKCVTLIFQA